MPFVGMPNFSPASIFDVAWKPARYAHAPPYRRIRFLCTSCTKLQQGIAAGNLPDTGRFGSDQGLKVHKVQECRFDQLCLENGAFHSNERLIREYQRPSFME